MKTILKQAALLGVVAAVMSLVMAGCTMGADTTPPQVQSTIPANEAVDVDPNLTELSVTFNEPMTDGGWSWAYKDEKKFPKLTTDPIYSNGTTINTVGVKLKPNKKYVIWLNSEEFTNFKDAAGNALAPYKWTFTTGAAD